MAREYIDKCDQCGETEGVTKFQIHTSESLCEVDLCGEHGQPIVKLMALGRAVSSPTARGGRERREMERLIRADGVH